MIFNPVKAQQAVKTIGNNDTIKYVKPTKIFYLNNQKLKIDDLKKMLNKFSSSSFEFKQYQKRNTSATVILLAGTVSGVIGFIRIKEDKNFFTPYSITLFTANIIGIPLVCSARKHLRKSVSLYNMEIIK